jgi:RNA polymerase sigma-70 factor, ECF subfamily
LFKSRKVDTAVEPILFTQEARDLFVSAHMRRIFLQIYRMVGNVADAQDLTQEAFIKALQRTEQLKDEQKAAHWLSRIATNTALDFLRRHGRVTFCEIEYAPESHSESPEDELLRNEHRDYLRDALGSLTPRERAAFVLRDVEDLPAEEVAQRLCCSKATVRSHIANARIKLKKYMAKRKR